MNPFPAFCLPRTRRLAMAAGGLLTLAAAAAPPQADPLDARSAVPAAIHRSAIGAYRRGADPEPGSWRAANETVNRIGGWRSYARERSPDSGPASAPAAAASAASPRP